MRDLALRAATSCRPGGLSVQPLCLNAQAHYHSSGKAGAALSPRATFCLICPVTPSAFFLCTQVSPRDQTAEKPRPVTQVTAGRGSSTDADVPMPPERNLARKSRRSYGIVSLEQLLEAGMSSAQVKDACKRGSLERVLPRVYRVTSVPEAWEQRPMAGTLWGEPSPLPRI